jgi:hypothetical protein
MAMNGMLMFLPLEAHGRALLGTRQHFASMGAAIAQTRRPW